MILIKYLKSAVQKKYPNAFAIQGFTWMIYDRKIPPITQIGRGITEYGAWQDAYYRMKETK